MKKAVILGGLLFAPLVPAPQKALIKWMLNEFICILEIYSLFIIDVVNTYPLFAFQLCLWYLYNKNDIKKRLFLPAES